MSKMGHTRGGVTTPLASLLAGERSPHINIRGFTRNEEDSMRSVRYLVVLVVLSGFSMSVFGFSREGREPTNRDRDNAVVKFVKRVVRALGDGLTVPGTKP